MKYKRIPNTTIEVPTYYGTLPALAVTDKNLLARNCEIVRRLKEKFFGGAK